MTVRDEIDRLIDLGSVRYSIVGLDDHVVDAITDGFDEADVGWAQEDERHLLVARADEETADLVFTAVLDLEVDDPVEVSDEPVPHGELVIVFEDNSQFTVELMRQRLAGAGIASYAAVGPGGGYTEVPAVVGLYQLRVHESNTAAASEVLGVAPLPRPSPFHYKRWVVVVAALLVGAWTGVIQYSLLLLERLVDQLR